MSQEGTAAGRGGKLLDDALWALSQALDHWHVGQVQGFHYPPQYVIRDCMRKPGSQVVWEGPDTDEPTFRRQCEIERMRVAVGLWLSNVEICRAALSSGEKE